MRPILDVDDLVGGSAEAHFIGREIDVHDVRVQRVNNHGFWVSVEHSANGIFVVPAEGSLIRVRPGQLVSLYGEVRPGRQHDTSDGNRQSEQMASYVYAYTVRPAW